MSYPVENVYGPVEDMLKIASGAANNDAPHLTVPFYMPLAPSISLQNALNACSTEVRKAAIAGTVKLLALAHGKVADDELRRTAQFVLLFGKLYDEDPDLHYLFDCLEGELELAVLMDGDGLRFCEDRPLSQAEAVDQWMGGFLNWNETYPGLYQLRYALIES